MADDLTTVSDLIADRLDLSDAEVSDLLLGAPFVGMLPAEESSNGTTHLYSKEVGAPVVGFRAENSGREFDSSQDTLVTINLKILDWSSMVDKAVADAWRKGGGTAFVAREGLRHMRSALSHYEKQILNGTVDGDSAGFVGMADVLSDIDGSMVVDAGGSSTDGYSSVYAVRVGENDVIAVFKGDSIEPGETTVIDAKDATGKHFPAYYTPGTTWVGVQVGSAFSFGRIANLGTGNNETLDDDLIAELLSKFPSDRPPTHLVMNRRSLFQLRSSRTATNATGAPAPIPSEAFGIPIVSTDSITNDETAVS
jgi:hypothetical protein